jgi:hypothetical protein
MARTVFQIRHYTVEPNSNQTKMKSSQERSVQLDESASSLTACVPFKKPYTRGIPGRCEHAFDKISDCTGNLSNLSELLWLLRRSVSRTILDIPVHFPTDHPQKIPFWTGYNSSLSEFKSEF